MSSSDLPPFPPGYHNQMLSVGLVTMTAVGTSGGEPHIPMYLLVKGLLNSTANLNETLGPVYAAVGIPGDPRATLTALDQHLDTLPHNSYPILRYGMATNVVGAVCILLRVIYRKWFAGGLKRDDWAMFAAAFLAFWHMCSICSAAAAVHACHHVWTVTFWEWTRNYLLIYIGEMTYIGSSFLIKLSLLLFYWDLSPLQWFRKLILATGWFILSVPIIAIMVVAFECQPINFWNNPLMAKCIDLHTAMYTIGWLGISGDVIVLTLPVPLVIWCMSLKMREKLTVIGMFLAGSVACIAGAFRVITTQKFIDDPDGIYKEGPAALYSQLELDLAIIIYSFPCMRGLFVHYWRQLPGKKRESNSLAIIEYDRRRSMAERAKKRFKDSFGTITDWGKLTTDQTFVTLTKVETTDVVDAVGSRLSKEDLTSTKELQIVATVDSGRDIEKGRI